MRLSIIIPVYNVEAYVGQTLESVFTTTASADDFEVIIVNDGTKDGSMDVVRRYADRPNITIIEQENQGLSAARNHGLDLAKGDYVWFVDSDDWLVDDGVGKVLRLLEEREGAEVLMMPLLWVDSSCPDQGQLDYEVEHERTLCGKEVFRSAPIRGFGRLMRYVILRHFLISNYWLRFPVGLLFEDAYFGAAVIYSSSCVIILPDPVYVYRVNRLESLSSLLLVEYSCSRVEIYRRLMVFMKKNVNSEDRGLFQAYCFNLIPHCYDKRLFGQQGFVAFVQSNGEYLYRQWREIHPTSSLYKRIARHLFYTKPGLYFRIKSFISISKLTNVLSRSNPANGMSR